MGYDFTIINKETGEILNDPKNDYDPQIPYGYIDIWDCETIQGHRSDIVARSINDAFGKLREDGIKSIIEDYNEFVKISRSQKSYDEDPEEWVRINKYKFTYYGAKLLRCCEKFPNGYWFGDNSSAVGKKGGEMYGVKPIDYEDIYVPPPPPTVFCYYKKENDEMTEIRNAEDIRRILRNDVWSFTPLEI